MYEDALRYRTNCDHIQFPSVKECISTFLSKKVITNVFIADIDLRKQLFSHQLSSIPIDYLTADHTFSVTKKIGYIDPTTNTFVRQYTSLFFGNEWIGYGQIVAYMLGNHAYVAP